jgi:hypothetical protein
MHVEFLVRISEDLRVAVDWGIMLKRMLRKWQEDVVGLIWVTIETSGELL